jgi:hypothetical protein
MNIISQVTSRCTVVAAFAITAFATGCASNPTASTLKTASKQLADVGVAFDKYGTITMSAPLLVRADANGTPPFAFDLGRTPQEYYTDAKTEIQASSVVAEKTSLNIEAQGRLSQDTTLSNAFGVSSTERERAAQLDLERRAKDAAVAEQERLELIALMADEKDPAKKATAIKEANDRYYSKMALLYPTPGAIPTSQTVGAPRDGAATGFTAHPSDRLGAFKDAFELAKSISTASPTVTSRSAIIAAAGDTTIQGIFKVLGDPQKALTFEGKETLYGVTMISVTPGRLTRRKFSANISASASITLTEPMLSERFALMENWASKPATPGGKTLPIEVLEGVLRDATANASAACAQFSPNARRIPQERENSIKSLSSLQTGNCTTSVADARDLFEMVPIEWRGQQISFKTSTRTLAARRTSWSHRLGDEFAPTVAAVSPMTESQTLDLGSSSQSQFRIALALAASLTKAGDQRNASLFSEYARSLTAESISRTPQNLVTGYASGNVVGYQVGPGFSALVNPGSKDPKAGEILQRQSFPALMLFGIHPDISAPKIHLVDEIVEVEFMDDGRKKMREDHVYKLLLLAPVLELQQNWRWQPRRWMALVWRTLTEDERLSWIAKVDSARSTAGASNAGAQADFLYSRAKLLESMVNATTVKLRVPHKTPKNPAFFVASVAPDKWFLPIGADGKPQKTDAQFLLSGSGLDRATMDQNGLIGAKNVVFKSVRALPDGKSAIVDVTLNADASGTLLFKFLETGTNNPLLAGSVEIKGPSQPSPPAPKPVVRYREGNGTSATREIAVFSEGAATVTPQLATEIIRAEIEKAKPLPPPPETRRSK